MQIQQYQIVANLYLSIDFPEALITQAQTETKYTCTLGLQWKRSFFLWSPGVHRLCQLLGFLKRRAGTWQPSARHLLAPILTYSVQLTADWFYGAASGGLPIKVCVSVRERVCVRLQGKKVEISLDLRSRCESNDSLNSLIWVSMTHTHTQIHTCLNPHTNYCPTPAGEA